MNAFYNVSVRATDSGFFGRIGRQATSDYFKVSESYLCFPMFTHPRKRNKEANVAVLSTNHVEDSRFLRHKIFCGYGYHTNYYLAGHDCAANVFAIGRTKPAMYYWLLEDFDFRSVLSCTDWIMGQWSSLVEKHGEDKAFKRYEKALRSFIDAGRDVGDEWDIDEDIPF